ncbi:hypothetical protein K461DRAFT_53539 [Myriangium duriaei CBS 260.36]|uniref:Uncharacterized protein n=1 Tax=Myriangium duriaei CBS 260.36 TaxID=1168546 RepID=A0A9P4MDF0_9PEZI|nr:hypothetical protein K461DRAFT_53539 [Myriangium duriaei CBS 260.36]
MTQNLCEAGSIGPHVVFNKPSLSAPAFSATQHDCRHSDANFARRLLHATQRADYMHKMVELTVQSERNNRGPPSSWYDFFKLRVELRRAGFARSRCAFAQSIQTIQHAASHDENSLRNSRCTTHKSFTLFCLSRNPHQGQDPGRKTLPLKVHP